MESGSLKLLLKVVLFLKFYCCMSLIAATRAGEGLVDSLSVSWAKHVTYLKSVYSRKQELQFCRAACCGGLSQDALNKRSYFVGYV